MRYKAIAVYTALAVLCIAGLVSAALSVSNSTSSDPLNQDIANTDDNNRAVTDSSPSSRPAIVGISRGTDYSTATREAIERAGGLGSVIKPGDSVIIKPNLVIPTDTGDATITDHRAVAEVVKMAYEAGAKEVIIGEGAVTGTVFTSLDLPINKYDTIPNVTRFIDFGSLTDDDIVAIKPEHSYTGEALWVPKALMDADVFISMPKLKTHPMQTATLSVKNLVGIAPLSKYTQTGYSRMGLHDLNITKSIVDLNLIRKPDFAIIEGIVGAEGYPWTPVDSQIMIAGRDPVAVDTVGLTFMGMTADEVPHIALAGAEGLGESDLSKITVEGADLNAIAMNFKRATFDMPAPNASANVSPSQNASFSQN